MVYQDIQNNKKSDSSKLLKPVLLDRFFSFLIDYLVLSPFISFLTYLFFKDALLYWKANPVAPEQSTLIPLLVFSLVTAFSLMQAVFIWLWQATPGQYFLKIRVQFEYDQNLIFFRAFLRQISFWLGPIFLGLPWISILSHPQRQTFYDRLADCHVVTLKSSSDSFTFETEGRYWQSLFATLFLFVSFLLVSVVWMKYEKVIQRVASFKKLEKQKFFCEELKDIQISQRLSTAIAMNMVGQLSNDCLDKEADFVIWKEKGRNISLAYFAKSQTEENEETEQKYLAQACENEKEKTFSENSMGCQLAQSYATGEFEDMYAVLKDQNSLLAETFKYELGLVLEKDQDVAQNFKALKKYDTHTLVKKYLLTEMLEEKSSSQRSPASSYEKIYDQKQAEQWVEDL